MKMHKPKDIRHINLRLREDLRRQLEEQAARHRFTLTNEIRIRLEDSFERDFKQRAWENLISDMEICWARFATRFLRMDLGDQLADAVMKGDDAGKIKTLARLIVEHRAAEQRSVS